MSKKLGYINVMLGANTTKLMTGMKRAQSSVKKFVGQSQKAFRKLKKSLFNVKSAVVALAAAFAGGKALEVATEYERLEASLVTVTGSANRARQAMAGIEAFTARTPYQVAQVTDAFIKLKALGLDASEASMTSYGNTASAMGKDLNQMIEAVADASTGEFERLKEFGIKARSQGDEVSFTFQGVTKTVGKNAKEITDYLKSIGNVQFAGAMDRQMDTLGGKMSNLSDAWGRLINAFFAAGLSSTSKGVIDHLTDGIKWFTDLVEVMPMVFTAAIAQLEKGALRAKKAFQDLGAWSNILDGMGAVQRRQAEINAEYERQIALIDQAAIATIAGYQDEIAARKAMQAEGLSNAEPEPVQSPAMKIVDKEREALQASLIQLQGSLVAQEDAILQSFLSRALIVEEAYDADIIRLRERNGLIMALEDELNDKRKKSDEELQRERLRNQTMFMTSIAGTMAAAGALIGSESRKAFKQQKKFQRGATLINTAAAIMSALGGPYPYPVAIAMAASAAAQGAVQLAAINKASFTGGGGSTGFSVPTPGPISSLPNQSENSRTQPKTVVHKIQGIGLTDMVSGQQLRDLFEMAEEEGVITKFVLA